MQRQSNNVMIQNFIFRIVFLLISKITVILVTDRQEFISNCSLGNKTKLSDTAISLNITITCVSRDTCCISTNTSV